MIDQGHGLIVNVASHAAGRGKTATSRVILPYSVCKAGLHRLSGDMSVQLRATGVPASTTEGVLAQSETFGDLSRWKAPLFTGRVVAAFAAEADALARSGEAPGHRGSRRRTRNHRPDIEFSEVTTSAAATTSSGMGPTRRCANHALRAEPLRLE
jgi:short-subunit dehydrogenase